MFICTQILTKCVSIDFTKVTIGSLTLSTSSHSIPCFLMNSQGPVVRQVTCQMDRDATLASLLGTESLTSVTKGT